MANKYFKLLDDVSVDGRWFLNGLYDRSGIELDSRDFTIGQPVEVGPPLRVSLPHEHRTIDVELPVRVSISRHGKPLDFTFAAFDMPVVTGCVADLLESVAAADIQRIPIDVESREGPYEVVNVVSRVSCIDISKSEIDWFSEGNDIRPDLVGRPEMITKLVIDPDRVGDHQIFRPVDWEVVVIVSHVVKRIFEDAHITGIGFREV